MPRPISVLALLVILAISGMSGANPVFSKDQVQTFASLQKPVNVSWTGNGFIGSYRDGVTRLNSIDVNGNVQPFAPSFSGKEEVYIAVSQGGAGFPPSYLFLCSGDSIYKMDPSGTTVDLFSTPAPGSTVEFVTFDTDGAWGHLLYAVTGSGGLWAINSTGGTKLVTNLGDNLMPEGIAVATPSFGAYAGDMLVSIERAHDVVAVTPTYPPRVIPLAQFPGEAPERVLLIPSKSDLFVAKYDLGTLVKIGAENFSSFVGFPLIITEGEAGQVGSLTVLKPAAENVTTIRLFSDPTSPHFEGAAFVPTYATDTTATASASAGQPAGLITIAAVSIVAVAFLVSGLLLKRRSGKIGSLVAA